MMMEYGKSLKALNTFGIDAVANVQAITTVEQIQALVPFAQDVQILGGGSNILLQQEHVEALVLKNEIMGRAVLSESAEHVVVLFGGGENWHEIVLWTLEQGWSGIENLSLIPGTVGAAPIQNIGAYGVELKDVFYQLEAVDLESGQLHTFSKEDCQFGYRESIFKGDAKGRYMIVRVALRLNKVTQLRLDYGSIRTELQTMGIANPTAKDVSKAVIAIRQSKLPDPEEIGNAGSFFKNPVISTEDFDRLIAQYEDMPHYPQKQGVKLPAAWLIQQAGWKGHRAGDAGVHKRQALVLVNYGEAKGSEIVALSEKIQASVWEKFQVRIEREINLW